MLAEYTVKTRQLKFHEAYKLYQCAVKICANDNKIRAKLLFNLGLGMQKSNHLEQAAKYFQKSIEAILISNGQRVA